MMRTVDVRRGWAAPAVLAALAVLALVGVWLLHRYFVGTEPGQLLDDASWRGASIGRRHILQLTTRVLDPVSVVFVAGAAVTVFVIAVVRRRFALGVLAVVVVGGANVTTQLLKYAVFDRPDLGVQGPGPGVLGANTLPSGHTTVAASVAVALLLVVPARLRPPTALVGAGYAAATGVSVLAAGWHRPSDAAAAAGVVAFWAFGAQAVYLLFCRGSRGGGRDAGPPPGTVWRAVAATTLFLAAAVATAAAAAALWHSLHGALPVASRRELAVAYLGGAAGIVAAIAGPFAILLVTAPAARGLRRDREPHGDGVPYVVPEPR